MTAVTEEKYLVFDPSGRIEKWLEDGFGVNVWRCVDMSSYKLGTLTFTRGDGDTDKKPSWQDEFVEQVWEPKRLTFFKRVKVEKLFSDSGQGRMTAHNFIAALYRGDKETGSYVGEQPSEKHDELLRHAPMGLFHIRFTVDAVHYESAYFGYDPKDKALNWDGSRPFDTLTHTAVIRWEAVEKVNEPNS